MEFIRKIESILTGQQYSLRVYTLIIFLVAFFIYSNSISNGFSLDDHLVVLNHKFVSKGLLGVYDILTNLYQNEGERIGEYRPIPQISFAIENEIFGVDSDINHFFNVLYYAILSTLLFRLWLTLFGKGNFSYIFLGSLFFAVHPIHTEVAASLKNRENIFSMLFGVLSCFYAIRFYGKKERLSAALVSLLFFTLALLSKVDSVVFLPIIGLVGYYQKASWKKMLFLLVMGVAVYFTKNILVDLQIPQTQNTLGILYHENPLTGESSVWEKLSLCIASLSFYLKILFLPYPLRLYYGYNMIPLLHITDISLWLTIVVYCLLFLYVVLNFRKRSILTFSILWYFISISIFSQIPELVTGIVAERHAFIASSGFCIALAIGVWKIREWLLHKFASSDRIKIQFHIFILTIMVVCFVYVADRNNQWDTSEKLLAADMPKLQNSVYAHFEYANSLSRKADKVDDKGLFDTYTRLAIDEYLFAAQSYGEFPFAWYNVGISYLRLDSMATADIFFRKAWERDSTFRSTNYFIGLQAAGNRDTPTAINFYERELRYRPENIRAIERLYDMCVYSGQVDRALNIFKAISDRRVKNRRLYEGLSNLYYMKGDTINSIKWANYSMSDSVQGSVPFSW